LLRDGSNAGRHLPASGAAAPEDRALIGIPAGSRMKLATDPAQPSRPSRPDLEFYPAPRRRRGPADHLDDVKPVGKQQFLILPADRNATAPELK
jgi:hypothetical protein